MKNDMPRLTQNTDFRPTLFSLNHMSSKLNSFPTHCGEGDFNVRFLC